MEEKECSKCGFILPISKFEFRSDTNKYRGQCRKCNKGYEFSRRDRREEILDLLSNGLKKCGKCGEVKSLEGFDNDKNTLTNKTSLCKSCLSKNGYKKRSDVFKSARITSKRHGGTDEDEYDFASKMECEICKKKLSVKDKHFDHDHSNGLYRGVLCRGCNFGLGNFLDNITILENAIIYLKQKTKS